MLLLNKRIIYIEDDPRNRKLVELLLTAEGADVCFERWGTPATSLSAVFQHMPVDLILLDLMFPKGYSGYLIFQVLRHQPHFDGIPIAIISAADPSEEMPRSRNIGASGYIAKPIDSTIFAQQIRDLIAGKPVWFAEAQ